MTPEISLDGGATWKPAPEGVRVRFDDVDVPGEEERPSQLLFNFTHEGLITDLWVSRQEELDHNLATSSVTFDELVFRMVEEDS